MDLNRVVKSQFNCILINTNYINKQLLYKSLLYAHVRQWSCPAYCYSKRVLEYREIYYPYKNKNVRCTCIDFYTLVSIEYLCNRDY